ncbi:hypothetical protein [Bizionia arctica]|uniref:Adhesin domain-containing protein n=1 Tax=Bizionia arctica TaxID=1495645 RepID=A0A917GQ79_9FLAO|nr:hypothetical protein [Bizionia arctica]GGG53398.1 hypothetical protein GCM10010976_25480 [Bizionia arctica]
MKHIIIIGLFFLSVLNLSAQQKLDKISQSIKVTDDVTIDLNTNYTTIEIDTWNKDIIEIEAYVESSTLSKEELQTYLDNWKIQVAGSSNLVTISSGTNNQTWAVDGLIFNEQSFEALQGLEFELANMPIMDGLLESLNLSEIPELPEMPEMPRLPELPEGMTTSDFDYERYQDEGDAYMETWSKTYSDKYGKEYTLRMEAWAKQVESSEEMKVFQKNMEAWGEKFGKEFEEKYSKDMEAWGEQFGQQMEVRAAAMEQRMEAEGQRGQALEAREAALQNRNQAYEIRKQSLQESSSNMKHQKVKKIIKIKMPKGAKLKVNVRYGELIMASAIHNLKADLSHTSLLANSIDGSQTSINASYSPVKISNWIMGELKLNYVENANINTVNRLVLSANSSNINIGTLQGNAIIDGSFGDLIIGNITDTFNNLNIVLENSKAKVSLPKADYNLQYKGKNSRLKHPKKSTDEVNSSFTTGNLTSTKTIVVNAKYSQVIMQ